VQEPSESVGERDEIWIETLRCSLMTKLSLQAALAVFSEVLCILASCFLSPIQSWRRKIYAEYHFMGEY